MLFNVTLQLDHFIVFGYDLDALEYRPFTNSAPISASAADSVTFFIIAHTACNGPLTSGVITGDFLVSVYGEFK